MVEQRTENPCVPGSIPGGTTEDAKSVKAPISKRNRGFFIGNHVFLLGRLDCIGLEWTSDSIAFKPFSAKKVCSAETRHVSPTAGRQP